MELRELFESLGTVENFDATKLSAQDLVELLKKTGYNEGTEVHQLDIADEMDAFAYAGFINNSHRYVFAWQDTEDEEEPWLVSSLFVSIDSRGKISCDYGGMPIHQFDEEGEMNKYFERVRRTHKA